MVSQGLGILNNINYNLLMKKTIIILVLVSILVVYGGYSYYNKESFINKIITPAPKMEPVVHWIQQFGEKKINIIKSTSERDINVSGENLYSISCPEYKECDTLAYIGDKSFYLIKRSPNDVTVIFKAEELQPGEYNFYLENQVKNIRTTPIKIQVEK